MAITRKDMFDALNEFYGKVLEPRFDRIEKRLDGHDLRFQDILKHFDDIYQRFERLETEYYSISSACRELRISLVKTFRRGSFLKEKSHP